MNIPPKFKESIRVAYPPNNSKIFEEWFIEQWYARSMQFQCQTDRELLGVPFTSCYVNNNYGNDKEYLHALQVFLDDLPRDKKYFTVVQYDDAILNNVDALDLLQFNMSKDYDVTIPLLCHPQPFRFKGSKKHFASFIGSRTHPIRNCLENLKSIDGYYISYDNHPIEKYCHILHESMFGLCPRGYGLSSFRIQECLQYGAIPVVVTDKLITPHGLDFNDFGVVIMEKEVGHIDEILQDIPIGQIVEKQNKLQSVFNSHYTYEGAFKNIINYLENEAAYS